MKTMRFLQQGILAIEPSAFGIEYSRGSAGSSVRQIGKVAIVDIRGPLTQHDCYCFDSYDAIKTRVAGALSTSCEVVLLNLDTPGGDVAGCFDLSRTLQKMAAAAKKPLVAFVEGKAQSAGYALACAADRIVVSETASLGSIGCIATMLDLTAQDKQFGVQFAIITTGARKADGNPHVPITDEARAAVQSQIDVMGRIFFELVGDAREVSAAAVKALEAATFIGADAVGVGLADSVSTFDDFIASLNSDSAAKGGNVEAMAMSYKDAVAALKKAAESDDQDEAKKAKAALKAMGEGDEKKDDEKKDDKAKAEDPPKDEKKDDEKKDDKAKALASDPVISSLVSTVQNLAKRFDSKEEAEERAKLMGSRPDFDEQTVKALASQPLEIVRFAVQTYPKKAGAPTGGQVGAARAALDAGPSVRGEGQTGDGDLGRTNLSGEGPSIDAAAGLVPVEHPVKFERNKLSMRAMTRAEARALLAEQQKAQSAAGGAR